MSSPGAAEPQAITSPGLTIDLDGIQSSCDRHSDSALGAQRLRSPGVGLGRRNRRCGAALAPEAGDPAARRLSRAWVHRRLWRSRPRQAHGRLAHGCQGRTGQPAAGARSQMFRGALSHW